MNSVSVIVITKNEGRNIRECLASATWADEIVVVDSGSEDDTVQQAREFTPKVFVRTWEGFGEARNYAISQAAGEWIFWLDADERITPELRDEIRKIVPSASHAGYSVPRRSYFLSRWIHHAGWYPGRVVRLFRRGSGRFTTDRVHERLLIDGTVGKLQADLLHYTDLTLDHYFGKFNRYTSLAAEDLAANGEQFSLFRLLVNPLWTFWRMYVLQRGFLDGIPGLILCVLSACYVFTKYAKLWELTAKKEEKRG